MHTYHRTSNEYNYNQTFGYNSVYNHYKTLSNNFTLWQDHELYSLMYFDIWFPPTLYLLCIFFLTRFLKSRKCKVNSEMSFELDERMKYYEQKSVSLDVVPHDSPFLIRLNGRSFRNFTKKLLVLEENNTEPYSKRFQKTMLLTAEALHKEFKCATVYTHSDEITLVFNSAKPDSEHLFGGRVAKLISLIASCAGNSFLYNLMSFYGDKLDYEEPHMFDARLIVFPKGKEYEIVNHMIWRSKGNCTRNFITMYSEKILGKKEVFGMPNETRLKVLKELGHDLNSVTTNYPLKHGTFIKFDRSTKEHEYYVFRNIEFNDEMYFFLTENHDHDIYLSNELEKKMGMCQYEFDEDYEFVKI